MFDTYETIFAARADAYHAAMRQWPHARDAEFEAMLAPVTPRAGTKWCDVPAGGGYLWPYLAGAGVCYLAVEPADLFYDACPVGNGAERMKAPAEAIPLANGAVEVLVSLAGLHHAPDLDRIFREMHRLLAPDGAAVIADVAAGSPTDVFLNGFVDRHNALGHDGHFLDAATAPRLEAAGLRVMADEMLDLAWRFSTRLEMGTFCGMLFGLGDTPAEIVAEHIEAILGVDTSLDGIAMRWPLRRLVCRPSA